ncbi:cupin domain-containing protein [Amycolatopsis sp. TNS106]|uniref:cupin domain-containing protein n=1 Tax=Amycolatopsis sp. TNS106 TaxID=2861750 RepID=UPI001C55D528|nr:cupin domain-containing protein [Amycolatopsis sp. TNS106]QXV55852.1 cupin [Amycolatopsis sp. TNS106]
MTNEAWVMQEKDAEIVEKPALWLLADGEHTGGFLGANRLSLQAGEPGTKPHYHEKSAEAFYVLDGALRMLVGEETVTVERGGYVVIPPGVRHAFAAPPDRAADVLITLAPGVDRFGYFRVLPEILRGNVAPEEVERLHERYDVHFVDVPEWDAA